METSQGVKKGGYSNEKLNCQNSKMSEMCTVLQYLLELIQSDEVSNMARLAALTVINKLFESDKNCEIQVHCLKNNIVSSLIMTLDLGLSSKCDPADSVYVCVAMDTMWKLTQLPCHMTQTLMSECVIRRLLSFIDVQGDFFVHTPKLARVMEVSCENKQLIGKVKVVRMAPEPMEFIHRHTKNKLKSLSKLPSSLKVCSLFDTSQETDVDIGKHILQQGLAWEGSNIPGDVIGDHSDDWQDILVTKVIDGAFFWAHVGEETIKEVCSIQQQLNSGIQLENQFVCTSGDLVIVRAEMQGTMSFLRAKVVSVNGYACKVEVFLIDYGHTLSVSDKDVFVMQEYFRVIPKKISLCILDGLQAPSKDEDMSINAAAILANLAKQGFPYTGKLICQLDGMGIIERFLESSNNSPIAVPVLTLLANLGRMKKLCGEFMESGIIDLLLAKLSEGDSPEEDKERSDFYTSCVICLTNIMFRNPNCREKFYQCQGLDIVMQFLRKCVPVNSALYRCTLKLLKVFVGSADIGHEMDNKRVGSERNRNVGPERKDNVGSERKDGVGLQHKGTAGSLHKDPTLTSSRHGHQKVSSTRSSEKTEVTRDVDSEDENIPAVDRLVPESKKIQNNKNSPSYVLGSCVYISDDQKHELHPATKISNISSTLISQIICGMLNAGRGGVIYCGIDKDGTVFGLEMSRDDKDRFRLGIDQLVHGKLNPVLVHSNFEFKAIPVLQKGTREPIQDLYVIEIHVKAARGVTYTTNDDQCFYRYGAATNTLTKQEIRNLVALEEEDYFMGEVERLLERKTKLLPK